MVSFSRVHFSRWGSSSLFFFALAKSCPHSRFRASISSSFQQAAENPIFPLMLFVEATRRRCFRIFPFSFLVSRVRPRSLWAARSHVSQTLFSPAKHASMHFPSSFLYFVRRQFVLLWQDPFLPDYRMFW